MFLLTKDTLLKDVHVNCVWVKHKKLTDAFPQWVVFDKPEHDIPDRERTFKRCVNPSGEHAVNIFQPGFCHLGRNLLYVRNMLTATDSTERDCDHVHPNEHARRKMALFAPFAVGAKGVLVIAKTAALANELRSWLVREGEQVSRESGWAWTRIVDSCRAEAWEQIARTGVRAVVATAASCLARTSGKKRVAPGSEEEEEEGDCTRPPTSPLAPAAEAALLKASIDMLIFMDPPKRLEGSQCEKLVKSFRSTRDECGGRCMVLKVRDSW